MGNELKCRYDISVNIYGKLKEKNKCRFGISVTLYKNLSKI